MRLITRHATCRALGAALLISACTTGRPPPEAVVVRLPPAATASTAAAPSTTAPLTAPAASAAKRVTVDLGPGARACTFTFEAALFEDQPNRFVVAGVERFATEASTSCAAGVLYDAAQAKPATAGEEEPEALEGGVFQKPGRPQAPEPDEVSSWNLLRDLNFDGYADLCVVAMAGAYNYSQRCWVFEPERRAFRREEALDELIFLEVDEAKRQLSSGYRVGGPTYTTGTFGWQGRSLVKLTTVTTILGEGPDGKPLPKGYERWEERYERRGGKLVKVFGGPMRATP